MAHIAKVLDVAETFEKDLKGGTGYEGGSAFSFELRKTTLTNRNFNRRHAQLHLRH